ncbi:hypothetical protein HY995_02355 [Candidatus Micrarchaeota archaeon]|nr:hypothetical protein [Candidatus Micrarchaeota archaeon]
MDHGILVIGTIAFLAIGGMLLISQTASAGGVAAQQYQYQAYAPAPSYAEAPGGPQRQVAITGGVQEVSLRALGTGTYDRREIRVKAGIPVRLSFSADPYSGCGRALMIPDYGVRLISRNGETQTAEFTPTAGVHEYSCSMRMFRGRLIAE